MLPKLPYCLSANWLCPLNKTPCEEVGYRLPACIVPLISQKLATTIMRNPESSPCIVAQANQEARYRGILAVHVGVLIVIGTNHERRPAVWPSHRDHRRIQENTHCLQVLRVAAESRMPPLR